MLVIEVDEVEAVDVIVVASGCIGSPLTSVKLETAWRSLVHLKLLTRHRYSTSTLKTEDNKTTMI